LRDAFDLADGSDIMGETRHDEPSVAGDAQQGTGGIASGQATSTPDQGGSQPHLGSQPGHAGNAAGGTGENQGNNDDRVGIPGGPDEVDAVDNPHKH
jgi:hypothetical protein